MERAVRRDERGSCGHGPGRAAGSSGGQVRTGSQTRIAPGAALPQVENGMAETVKVVRSGDVAPRTAAEEHAAELREGPEAVIGDDVLGKVQGETHGTDADAGDYLNAEASDES